MTDRHWLAAIVIVLILQISVAIWWIPQKWRVCQRLYDNMPARINCVSSNG